MGLSVHNLEAVDPYPRSFIWTCLVAAAQNNKLEVCGNYLDGLLEEAEVPQASIPTKMLRLEEMDQKVNLMGATYMQTATNLSGESVPFLLKLPKVETYKGIVIYADSLPAPLMAMVIGLLEEAGYDYSVDTGYPPKIDKSPQPTLAICDTCTAHLIRVGRGLNTIILAMLRPCYTTTTVYDRAIELFSPLFSLSDKGVNWSDRRTYMILNHGCSKLIPMVAHFMEY